MARRYRYAFALQKQAGGGVYSVILAVASFLLFVAAIVVSLILRGEAICQAVLGGLSVGAVLLALYGFVMGMVSFAAEDRNHSMCAAGAIANGLQLVGWLGLYLMGVS